MDALKPLTYHWTSGEVLFSNQMNSIVSLINDIIDQKQDTIDDLADIRSNIQLGLTAITQGDIDDMMDTSTMSQTYKTINDMNTEGEKRQDIINDLDTIRDNAAKGASAAKKSELDNMQTKTDMASSYGTKSDLTAVTNNISIKTVDDMSDVSYLRVQVDGKFLKITPDNYEKVKNLTNCASCVWGVIIDPNNSSPELEPVGDYTYWESFKENIGRYLIVNSGKCIKLSKTDSSVAIDGTTIDETIGHVMVRIPQLYYNVVSNEDGTYTLWMSEQDIGGHMIPEIWVGAYLAYVDGTKLTSRSEVNPTRQKTITEFFNLAQANGSNFGLEDYNFRRAMMMIYLSEYHNLNSQLSLGYGMTGSDVNYGPEAEGELTGRTKTLGDSRGKVILDEIGVLTYGIDACHVSLFGIEDPYAWFLEYTQGIYFGKANNAEQDGTEVFIYEGNRLPTSSELSTHPNGEYRQLTRLTTSGWIKNMIAGPYFDLFPSTLDGSDSTYWCDYSGAAGFDQLAVWGGYLESGSACGICSSTEWDWDNMNDSVIYSTYCSTRLAYYGSPTIVQTYNELTA